MNKTEAKEKLRHKIIAVIRCSNIDLAEMISKTIIKSGINAIEVTFSVENAAALIKKLKNDYPEAVIGAGTVTNKEQAEAALESYADFIVSPCIIPEVGKFCKEKDVFCSMAGTTSTEAYNSYISGSDVVKLFPGEFLNPNIIKSLKAPFPYIDFMPTGGVSDKNIKQWFDAGAFAVGAGGYLLKGINESNLNELEERCKKLINSMK